MCSPAAAWKESLNVVDTDSELKGKHIGIKID
jgi:hypothetical protein